MISASVYRESCTPLIIGENRANFTNTIEPTKNCQKVKFNAMFRHCNSFELFNLENRWRFGIYITRIKFLRKSRSGVKIPKQAGPKVLNEAGAYFEEIAGYATYMYVTTCPLIQTVYPFSNYILNSKFGRSPPPLVISAKRWRGTLEFCDSQSSLISLILKARLAPFKVIIHTKSLMLHTGDTDHVFHCRLFVYQ